MIRAIIQYESEPDPERYQQHLDEFTAPVECSAFRHGKVFGAPVGEPKFRHYAEWEFPDLDAFKTLDLPSLKEADPEVARMLDPATSAADPALKFVPPSK